jgi:ribosomal protein S18 acetylase RimI-like enzyme
MTPQELASIAQRGMALLPSPLLRHQKNGKHEIHEGMALSSWGMPGPSFNKVAVFGPASSLARIHQLARAFFPEGVTYGVMVQADAGHPLEAELREANWQVVEDEAALVLPTLSACPPFPSGLEVRRVSDGAGRRDFLAVATAGFGAPTAEGQTTLSDEQLDSFGPSLAALCDPDVAVVVGYVASQPVCSAIAYRVEEIAAVTGVATLPEQRRRGLARAATWAALNEAAARGCTCATLNAAGASYHLYVGMGFLWVGNHRTYAAATA